METNNMQHKSISILQNRVYKLPKFTERVHVPNFSQEYKFPCLELILDPMSVGVQ